jgi:hypothetical protein
VPKYDVEDFRRLRRLHPGLRSVSGHPVTLFGGAERVWPDLRYFALLREPCSRVASHYQYHLRTENPDLGWQEWLDWPVVHDHMTRMLSPTIDVDDAIANLERHRVFVGLLERFDESLVLFRRLVAPGLNIAYERRNVARDTSVARELMADAGAVEGMRAISRKDLQLHEYVTQELYPRYVKEYGPTLADDVEAFRRDRAAGINRLNMKLSGLYSRLVFEPAVRWHRRRLRGADG